MIHSAKMMFGKKAGQISFAASATFSGAGISGGVLTYSGGFQDASGAAYTPQVGDCIIIMMVQATTASRSDAQLQPFSNAPVSGNELFTAFTGTKQSGADTNYASGRLFFQFVQSHHTQVTIPGCGAAAGSHAACLLVLKGVNTVTSPPQDGNSVGTGALNTGRPDPAANTLATIPGCWMIVGGGAASATGAVFTQPSDLSNGTNHFRSVVGNGSTQDAVAGLGFKSDWAGGSFDPVAWAGSDATSTSGCLSYTLALLPA